MEASAREDAQTSIDEKIVEDSNLEEALDLRAERGAAFRAAQRAYHEANEAAKVMLADQALADGDIIRVGRFRVKRRPVKAAEVAFTRGESSRYDIAVVKEES